jgi:hypothetical protein
MQEITLRLVFSRSDGRNLVMSYPVSATGAQPHMIKQLMEKFINRRDIFHVDNRPAGIVGAEYVSRSVQTVDL